MFGLVALPQVNESAPQPAHDRRVARYRTSVSAAARPQEPMPGFQVAGSAWSRKCSFLWLLRAQHFAYRLDDLPSTWQVAPTSSAVIPHSTEKAARPSGLSLASDRDDCR